MDIIQDSIRIFLEGQREYYRRKYLRYCWKVKRINNKISKLYAKTEKLSGYKLRSQQKKKVKYHALLVTYYQKSQRVKNWADLGDVTPYRSKLTITGVNFTLRKQNSDNPSGYSYFWCKIVTHTEACSSKVLMLKEYTDSYRLQIDDVFEFENVYDNMVITFELFYIFFPQNGDRARRIIEKTEEIDGVHITLQLSHLPFRIIGNVTLVMMDDIYHITNYNTDLSNNIPVNGLLDEDYLYISCKEEVPSSIRCL